MQKRNFDCKNLLHSKYVKRWLGVLSSGLIAVYQGFVVWRDIYPPQPPVSGHSRLIEQHQTEE